MDLIISLNKPKDITSHDAVQKVKKVLKARKAGHTGTLDPLATGVLLICTNRATRLANYFSSLDKEYVAEMKLGETTDTQDMEGELIEKKDVPELDKKLLVKTLASFKGKILQKPPMFSALKHKGKSLYKYARKGIEIDREAREVNIREIELISINLPFITFRTVCSKGTYIRTLCNDIGVKLGTGAHLYELERTAVGQFNIKDSVTLEELKSISEGKMAMENVHGSRFTDHGIYTIDEALSWLPEFIIKEDQIKSAIHGHPVKLNSTNKPANAIKEADGIRIKSPSGDLLSIGRYSAAANEIKMDVVLT